MGGGSGSVIAPPGADSHGGHGMQSSMVLAALAGVAWGVGGYFEKSGLQALGLPPIAGITVRTAVALLLLGALSVPAWKLVEHPENRQAWLMLVIGGGVVAGALGMWCFYGALRTTTNLGVTLAIAFACSPVAGTLAGVIRRDQPLDLKIVAGLVAIVVGIVLVQLGRGGGRAH
jgi:bacterial/archaeal transporter family protein